MTGHIDYYYLPPTKEEVYVFVRTPEFVCLSVCVQHYSKTRACIWMKCCMSTDVGTWTNWLTFEPDPDHNPDAGTGFLPPISYRLRNFAALPSLAYFSAISVSICAKLARSILMTDRNTATEPNFRKTLSKFKIMSPKNSYLSISHVNQQKHCSNNKRPMTARSIFSLSVFFIFN